MSSGAKNDEDERLLKEGERLFAEDERKYREGARIFAEAERKRKLEQMTKEEREENDWIEYMSFLNPGHYGPDEPKFTAK